MISSTVYLTGAGPGDPKLITVRGLEAIQKADCIIYDHLAAPALLKYARKDCELIYAGKSAGNHALPQYRINRLLAQKAGVHETVVRLKGGDPFIFGRGGEEARYLKSRGIRFEIIPGVSSAVAVPAYAGIPLTMRGVTSTVGFITGHEAPGKERSDIDWRALSKALGTMVFLMGVKNLSSIAKKLIACGKPANTPAAVIGNGTTAKQRLVSGTLADIAELAKKSGLVPPAIIVVGEVAGPACRLGWFEKKPLFGKRIVVTRAREQAGALSERLSDLGAEVMEAPVIKFRSLNADKKVKKAFSGEKQDWVFFTSRNGVSEFSAILNRLGRDLRILKDAKVCAIGSETAKALSGLGIKADHVPDRFVSESLVADFNKRGCKGKKALILRAAIARDVLPEGLARAGMVVRTIDLYDTLPLLESRGTLKAVFLRGADLAAFTSSSTVKNFTRLLGKDYRRRLAGVKLASIGPVTSAALREAGLEPDAEAEVYTIKGLTEAITGYYKRLLLKQRRIGRMEAQGE